MSDVALRFGATDDGSITAQFRKIDAQLEKFKSGASSVADSIGGVFKALSAIGVAVSLAKLTSEALEFADSLKKVQAQTELSTDAIQRLQFMAGQTSVDTGSLTDGVIKLQRALGGFEEGSEQAAKALERLGLANAEFQNRNPEQQFIAVAEAVSGLTTQNERVLAVTELFGKSGANLLPVLQAIGNESAQLGAKFDAIGGPVGKAAIDAVDDLGDELSATALAAKSLATEILAIGAPPAIATLNKVQQFLAGMRLIMKGGQGANEDVNLDNRIRELETFIETHPTGLNMMEQMRIKIRNARNELFKLKQLQQQTLAGGIGLDALLNPRIQNFPVNIGLPETVGFEEDDEDRKKREKEESDARLQRIQQIATMHQIEQDMEFRNNLKLKEIDQARIDEEIQRTTDAVGKKLQIRTDAEEFFAGVRRTFGLEEIKFEEIKDQSILEIALGMFGALARENSKLAKIQQGIALAQTIWSTATGIMKAFETLPWPANLAAAAKVALTGAIQVAKIKSTNYQAGSVSGTAPTLSGGSAVGSAPASTPPPDEQLNQAQGATTVYVSGMITKDIVDYLVEGLRDGFDRNVILIPQNSLQAQVIRGA